MLGDAVVTTLILPAARLRLARFVGEVRLPLVMAEVERMFAADPDVPRYDSVLDLRRHTGNLGTEGMRAICARVFGGIDPPPPVREVLLSRDPGIGFSAKFLGYLAPHVTYLVRATPAEAVAAATGGAVPAEALAFLDQG
jgi:hypothetical protein